MFRTYPPKTFENLDEKWYQCWLEVRRYYPESRLIEADDGHRYCTDCYHFRFDKDALDDYIPEVTDDLD